MDLIKRCELFINEFDIPVTAFCRKIRLSPQSFYNWKKQELKLSDSTLKRIDVYLHKYGF